MKEGMEGKGERGEGKGWELLINSSTPSLHPSTFLPFLNDYHRHLLPTTLLRLLPILLES